MNNKPFVLALTGPPGAGKSTVAALLQRRHAGARIISYDKYQSVTRLSQTQIRDWFAAGADLNQVDHSEVLADLTRETSSEHNLAQRRLLLFETPFGRAHRETGAFIDFLVWIDTPLDIALARAVLAFTENAQRDTTPEAARDFINWQKQYMTFYPVAREMYLTQHEKVAPTADLSIDGSRPPEASAETISMSLLARGVAL
jgi:uridine kinase